jgi:arginine/lysine/ornithine decarboxylase
MASFNDMSAPIYEFVADYLERRPVRCHMPGHKGKPFPGLPDPFAALYPYDITEISGADSLFESAGVIKKSEENAARLFNVPYTFYSTGGSTLCIQTMLSLMRADGVSVVAAGRNCHAAFVNACKLLDIDIVWFGHERGRAPSHLDVADALTRCGKPAGVYVTSPDYYGRVCDVAAIARVCKERGAVLAVDGAHGAYLAFTAPSAHPIALGADVCCDSAHKTLPVLTGGAYLHIADPLLAKDAKEHMRRFASSSPSYLILQSLDLCNLYLNDCFRSDLADTVNKVSVLKTVAGAEESEPLKLLLRGGFELAAALRENRIEPELSDGEHVVLMMSTANTDDDFKRLTDFFVLRELRVKG